jgi:hypothetical protein
MAQDLTADVVARLEDDEICERARAGDLSDFADVDLDEQQRAALVQLAENADEVAGFSIFTFDTLIGGKGLTPFHPRLSTAQQVTEVKVRGYDPVHKKEIIGGK